MHYESGETPRRMRGRMYFATRLLALAESYDARSDRNPTTVLIQFAITSLFQIKMYINGCHAYTTTSILCVWQPLLQQQIHSQKCTPRVKRVFKRRYIEISAWCECPKKNNFANLGRVPLADYLRGWGSEDRGPKLFMRAAASGRPPRKGQKQRERETERVV